MPRLWTNLVVDGYDDLQFQPVKQTHHQVTNLCTTYGNKGKTSNPNYVKFVLFTHILSFFLSFASFKFDLFSTTQMHNYQLWN